MIFEGPGVSPPYLGTAIPAIRETLTQLSGKIHNFYPSSVFTDRDAFERLQFTRFPVDFMNHAMLGFFADSKHEITSRVNIKAARLFFRIITIYVS